MKVGQIYEKYCVPKNLTDHMLRVASLATIVSQNWKGDELDFDSIINTCLFHDIGKVVEGEGSHVKLGVELLKKFNIPEKIINCVAEHHEDKPFSSMESVIVSIADQISGARPGARFEDIEGYTKRLRDMEGIAKKYEGVDDAYAFEAGRELRVIINPGRLDDAQTTITANKIREEVSHSLAVPGEVKVTAIREFRAVSSETSV